MTGTRWYGAEYSNPFDYTNHEFAYEAEKTFNFSDNGDHITGYDVTLFPVTNGNLSTKRIPPSEF